MNRAATYACLASLLAAHGAYALPTMIRLGYPNCVSCHVAPQGGGLLNAYGRGIDQAQSRKAGEYKPTDSPLTRLLTLNGRMRQDIRWVGQEVASAPTGDAWASQMRNRFVYRNATELGRGFRLSAVVTGETRSVPRPQRAYSPALEPGRVMLSSALVQYRPKEGFEIAAGRDLLPTGVYVADLGTLLRTRNQAGYYDTPTQVKMFIWGKRYQITPYAFGPSGNEPARGRETGGGTLAEFDLTGGQKTIVGVTALRGTSDAAKRNLLGVFTRLGFGRWGILAEHDVTSRSMGLNQAAGPRFRQHATYAQGFYAIREWLVASAIGEQLSVQRPYREDLRAGRMELAARLSPSLTVLANFRMQRNMVTGTWAPSATLQLAMKPVY